MDMNSKKVTKTIITYTALSLFCVLVVGTIAYNYILKYKQNKMEIKSRYTFTIRIDQEGNMISEEKAVPIESEEVYDFSTLDISKVAEEWLNGYVNQYKRKFVANSKAITSSTVNSSKVLNSANNTVLLSFSVKPVNVKSDFFTAWDGFVDNGLLKCDWVVSFYVDNNYDNTATVYVTSVMSSEDYGLSQYNANQANKGDSDNEVAANTNKDALANYHIKDNSLYVTYDGDKNILVPVSSTALPYDSNSTTTLKEGSYMITTDKTAFVYGGNSSGGSKIPLSVVFSDDKGLNWTTCELDSIYTADYYYIHFFDEKNGVVVCGYGKSNDTFESSKIYKTKDGGETWKTIGSGPATNIIKGIIFITPDIGFFCYDYVTGMDSNLYKTTDGGETFSKVIFEAQELDSSAAKGDSKETYTWSDVYKESLVPVLNTSGSLTVYLSQGKNGIYNDGKTAAKYQSTDNGATWRYIGQLEIK